MKVLMWVRYDLLDSSGGDRVQVENTALELRKIGVEVDVSTNLSIDITKYDVIHVFQLDWMAETYFYAKKAKKFGKPLVLSPIHHNVKEVQRFDDEYALGLRKLSRLFFKDQHNRDTLKNVYRSIFDRRKLMPTLASIFIGLKNMHIETLRLTDKVLVQTELEAKDLMETYGVQIKWEKISNGVSEPFTQDFEYENVVGVEDYILCVGRIEARKNQLNIISAVEELINEEDTDINLVFCGRKSQHHPEYIKEFENKVATNTWITYINELPNSDMPPLYKYAKVCVSASWFETSGLTSLEALFLGTNVVVSGNRAKEILGDKASYCDPGDVVSIKRALSKELSAPRPELDSEFKSQFTWKKCAELTKKVYEELNANN